MGVSRFLAVEAILRELHWVCLNSWLMVMECVGGYFEVRGVVERCNESWET